MCSLGYHKECRISTRLFENQIHLFETNLDDIQGKSGHKTKEKKREGEKPPCDIVSLSTRTHTQKKSKFPT